MIVKVFQKNKNGKIEFTKEELEALLNEVYWDGYRANSTWTWTTPVVTNPVMTNPAVVTPLSYSTTTTDKDTANSYKITIGD